MALALRTLESAQRRFPIGTSALTGFSVMAIGDTAVQLASGSAAGAPHDVQRTAIASTYNGLVYSPLMHLLWARLDAIWPGRTMGAVARKVLANQLIVTPVNSLSFITWAKTAGAAARAAREGRPLDWEGVRAHTEQHLRRELPGLIGSSCCFWPVAHGLNFALVPLSLRIVFMSACSVTWGAYLSFVTHRTESVR
jgi:protein Mpv17